MTNRPARPTYEPDSIGADNRDGNVLINIYTDVTTGEGFVLRLGPGAALAFAAQLVNQVAYAASDAAYALSVGDCATCKNTRLVDTVVHGRPSNDRCPDCGPRWREALNGPDERFPPYPRVGGGIR